MSADNNGRRLVGYRVRMNGYYLTDRRDTWAPAVNRKSKAHLYPDKVAAKERLSICNDTWKLGASIVAVYRRRKAGAK